MSLFEFEKNTVRMTKKNTRLVTCFEGVMFIIFMISFTGYAQVRGGNVTFTSPNPKINTTYLERDMMRFNYYIGKDTPNGEGGIVATMYKPTGKVTVSVYAFDATKMNGKGKRVYYAYSDETSSSDDDFIQKTILLKDDGSISTTTLGIASSDIRELGKGAKTYISPECLTKSSSLHRPKKWSELRTNITLEASSTINNACIYDYFSQPIILEVNVIDASLLNFKVPFLGNFEASKFKKLYETIMPNFRRPIDFKKNYIMVAAHRGYFRFRPENSISAMRDAIDLGVDMVEADVMMTKDNHLILSHDVNLGRLTSIPNHIKNNSKFIKDGRYMISEMNLCDLRPDLCSSQDEPVRLKNRNGQLEEKIPTFKEALNACRGKTIFDVDKVPNHDLVFREAEEINMVNQIVVKGRDGSPKTLLKKFPKVPWRRFKFTPIYISDMTSKDENDAVITTEKSIDNYVTIPSSQFDMPGIELIYRTDDDILLNPWGYNKILLANKHVFQFPQYPEVNPGVWNPRKFQFSDFDPRHDHRADWEWVLKKERRPTLLITDRLELLLELMKKSGLR